MLPFLIKGDLPFANGDYLYIKDIKSAVANKQDTIKAYVVNKGMKEFDLTLGDLTDDERTIILDGCLINYYRSQM